MFNVKVAQQIGTFSTQSAFKPLVVLPEHSRTTPTMFVHHVIQPVMSVLPPRQLIALSAPVDSIRMERRLAHRLALLELGQIPLRKIARRVIHNAPNVLVQAIQSVVPALITFI